MVARFGNLITASFFIMIIGIILFLLAIPLYSNFKVDTDILGLGVFTVGLALLIFEVIIRKRLRGWKLVVLAIAAAFLLMPLLHRSTTGWLT